MFFTVVDSTKIRQTGKSTLDIMEASVTRPHSFLNSQRTCDKVGVGKINKILTFFRTSFSLDLSLMQYDFNLLI